VIEYKGYIATVEYDDSVGLLHGQVINAGPYPIATFEASDVEGLKREFHISIEEYLASCEEDGIEPRQPFSGKLTLRLGPDLHQRVAASALQSGKSINEWIKHVLEESARSA
jgi:predicted HicB family RNase H-like nuclease